jgi:hypothetical protein
MLRQFAGLWLAFFGGLAAWQFWSGNPERGSVLAVLALTVGPFGLMRPTAVRPIFVGWMIAAFPIGWTMSLLMLGIVYYGLVTPLGLFMRLRRDPLERARPAGCTSYWTPKTTPADARSYFRPY